MAWEHLEHWFVSTVPGVVVLGAIGSLVAVVLLKTGRAIFARWLPDLVRRFGDFYYRLGYVHSRARRMLLALDDGAPLLPLLAVYAIYYATIALMQAILTVGLFLSFLVLIPAEGDSILTPVNYACLLGSIFLAVRTFDAFDTLRDVFKDAVGPALDAAAEDFEEAHPPRPKKVSDDPAT